MWVHLKRGPLADLSTPKDQNLEIKVKKTWRFGEKSVGVSMVSKRTKARCREDIKMKWIAKNTFSRIRSFPSCFELCLCLMNNFHRFPPF